MVDIVFQVVVVLLLSVVFAMVLQMVVRKLLGLNMISPGVARIFIGDCYVILNGCYGVVMVVAMLY